MVIISDILSNKTMIFIDPDDIFIGQVEKSLSRGGKCFNIQVMFSLYHYFLTSFNPLQLNKFSIVACKN